MGRPTEGRPFLAAATAASQSQTQEAIVSLRSPIGSFPIYWASWNPGPVRESFVVLNTIRSERTNRHSPTGEPPPALDQTIVVVRRTRTWESNANGHSQNHIKRHST